METWELDNPHTLPEPKILGWQALYQPGARAKCIKDMPPMHGFGRTLKMGDVVDVQSVCWRGKYEIAVAEECAFYELEGYFEVLLPIGGSCVS
jgi:hypothetical protein